MAYKFLHDIGEREIGILDTTKNARLVFKSRPDYEVMTQFNVDNVSLSATIVPELKNGGDFIYERDQLNPGIKIYSGDINYGFRVLNMTDVSVNTKIVLLYINMLFRLHIKYPVGRSAYFWSDYEYNMINNKSRKMLYIMPTNDELVNMRNYIVL